MKTYNKLVRDNIPDIIKKNWATPHTKIVWWDEYLWYLYKKLLEEVHELLEDESKEELADVQEVIDAICQYKSRNKEDVLTIQNKKRVERWGFLSWIVLEKVE